MIYFFNRLYLSLHHIHKLFSQTKSSEGVVHRATNRASIGAAVTGKLGTRTVASRVKQSGRLFPALFVKYQRTGCRRTDTLSTVSHPFRDTITVRIECMGERRAFMDLPSRTGSDVCKMTGGY